MQKKTEKKRVNKTNETNPPVYCVCRSTDGERFMIACDRCEEWYHGDCINVTPKQAEQIKTFYCHQCRRKEPSLEIEYKSTRSQKSKVPHLSSASEADHLDGKHGKTKRLTHTVPSSKHEKFIMERSPNIPNITESTQLADFKVSSVDMLHGAPECNRPSPSFGHSKDSWLHEDDQSSLPTISRSAARVKAGSPRARPCGSCSGCVRLEDCGKCDYCRDRRKFGGPNRIRQKCRLRQCVGSSHHRDPGFPTSGARRRKQQSLPNVLGSPHHNQYPEDDPFDVPADFSPHAYADQVSTIYSHHPAASNTIMGSKMRRGDLRGAVVPHDIESFAPYQRHPLDAAGDSIEFLDEDSDEDLILSGFPHCAGPACMSAPVAGGRYCSESCRVKHLNTRAGLRGALPQARPLAGEILYPYNLPYPDHMYCRHHRVYNWHGNPSVSTAVAYRTMDQPSYDHFDLDDAAICDTFHEARTRSVISYNTGPALSLSQHAQIHAPRMLSNNGRVSDLDNPDHAILCDSGDAAAFIDSMESAMMRGVVSLTGDLDLDVSTHPSVAGTQVSPTVNSYYTKVHSRPAVDLHHLEDPDDGLIPDLDTDTMVHDPTASHANNSHYYYMLPYPEINRRNPGSMFTPGSHPSDRRMESGNTHSKGSTNHRLLIPDNNDNSNVVGSSYSPVRSLGFSATNGRHRSGSTNPDRRVMPSVNDLSMVNLSSTSLASLTSYIPGPDEFYTINDSEDIEINWPQESVSGVNT